jgi:hypothetical protein
MYDPCGIRRITTKPTLRQRVERNPALYAALVFIVFFAFIGAAEFVSTMLGAAFDVRAG